MNSIYNDVLKLNYNSVHQKRISINVAVACFENFASYSAFTCTLPQIKAPPFLSPSETLHML